ncbi:MAG: periplasmic heavy metal sensor [Thermodesulfobacteriota bacterium]
MNVSYTFFTGFLTALFLTAAVLFGLYFYSRRKIGNSSSVQGYLDLIPDLSPKQRERVQEIRKTFLPRIHGIRQNLRRERAELARCLFSEPFVRDEIHEVAKRILDYQSELEREVIEHILEEKELLAPAQKRKFYQIIVEQFASGGLGVHDTGGR